MTRDLVLTFAGGGNRAFYQLGLMNRWKERLLPRTASIAACSAGAFVATLVLTGRHAPVREYWLERRAGVDRNFDLRRLRRGESPAPHGPIYRDTLLFAFSEGGFETIREQPFPIYVVASAFPGRWPAALAAGLGIATYQLEKALRRGMVHPSWGRRLGFAPVVVDARECQSKEELASLILASSATPPFTPIGDFRGQKLLDGGLVDNVPAFAAETRASFRHHLVLLTRPYPAEALTPRGSRIYVAPTQPVPVERWDYTRPHLIDETIAMGEREAAIHEARLPAIFQGADRADVVAHSGSMR